MFGIGQHDTLVLAFDGNADSIAVAGAETCHLDVVFFFENRAGDIEHCATGGERLPQCVDDPRLLARVALWAALNWLLDAAALLVFLRAFGGHIALDGLIIAFCLANVMAVIPITPGGLGIIEAVMIPTIVAFGPSKSVAALGVAAYRFAQYWFPLVLGAGAYLSLRVGPWSIDRRDRLRSLREEAARATEDDTSGIEWAEAYGRRRRPSDETSDLSWPPAPRSE